MRIVFICAALLVVGGCASNSLVPGGTAPVVVASSNTEVTPKSKLVCHKESPAGSNMIHTVCETEQSQADREAMQNKLLNVGQHNAAVYPAIGH